MTFGIICRHGRKPSRFWTHGWIQGPLDDFDAQQGGYRGAFQRTHGRRPCRCRDPGNLVGGIPIRVEGFVLGAVAAGSGTGAQDLKVARAGAPAVKGADMFLDFKPMGAEDTGAAPHSVDKKARSR
jgi:hypothetical protein